MSINERIRLILDRDKIANKDVAEWLSMTNSRLSQKFKDGIWDSVAELKVLADKTGYRLDWLISGKGPEKGYGQETMGSSVVAEAGTKMEHKPSVNRGEFYQELVETNSDYSLIPKSFINGDYRIMLKSELEEMNKTREKLIESKDKSISLLEKRIEDLERIHATVPQSVKK
jgi:hypothetical protein